MLLNRTKAIIHIVIYATKYSFRNKLLNQLDIQHTTYH